MAVRDRYAALVMCACLLTAPVVVFAQGYEGLIPDDGGGNASAPSVFAPQVPALQGDDILKETIARPDLFARDYTEKMSERKQANIDALDTYLKNGRAAAKEKRLAEDSALRAEMSARIKETLSKPSPYTSRSDRLNALPSDLATAAQGAVAPTGTGGGSALDTMMQKQR